MSAPKLSSSTPTIGGKRLPGTSTLLGRGSNTCGCIKDRRPVRGRLIFAFRTSTEPQLIITLAGAEIWQISSQSRPAYRHLPRRSLSETLCRSLEPTVHAKKLRVFIKGAWFSLKHEAGAAGRAGTRAGGRGGPISCGSERGCKVSCILKFKRCQSEMAHGPRFKFDPKAARSRRPLNIARYSSAS